MIRRAFRRLAVEWLESRRLLAAAPCDAATCLDIALVEPLDRFGRQVTTIQAYRDATETRSTLAIYDTGASVATFSAVDQLLLDLAGVPIPIKVPGGASAEAISGTIQGDVSEPGELVVDGLHAWSLGADLQLDLDLDGAAVVPGVQALVGTLEGSPLLPTITGTPVHNPSPTHPNGSAAHIDFDGFELDFGQLFPELPEFQGVTVHLPDLEFVEPDADLNAPAGSSLRGPVRIPLALMGTSNHASPGDMVTASANPVQTGVALYDDTFEQVDRTFLFDTGAQVTVISGQLARDLDLYFAAPEWTIPVVGAAGTLDLPGYIVDVLEVPRDDDADGTIDGTLRFSNVPVLVSETLPHVDGILGTNLFNTAAEMLYDPFDPEGPNLQVLFDSEAERQTPDSSALAGLDLLGATYPVLAGSLGGQAAPGFRFDAGPGWQNPVNPYDVDNDSRVAPNDVLRLFNLLNSQGSHTLPEPPVRETNSLLFYDVNGDGKAAPSDPLAVINQLNSFPAIGLDGAGEGESAVFAQGEPIPSETWLAAPPPLGATFEPASPALHSSGSSSAEFDGSQTAPQSALPPIASSALTAAARRRAVNSRAADALLAHRVSQDTSATQPTDRDRPDRDRPDRGTAGQDQRPQDAVWADFERWLFELGSAF